MQGRQIKEKLRRGEHVFGTHIASLMNPVAAAMAAEIELDFAFFCTEHMPIDRTEVGRLCQLYATRGISPVVRVPSPDAAAISEALDAGAEGIVVPYVETVDEVRLSAGAVRYRPIKGALLADVQAGRVELPAKTLEFLHDFNRDAYLIIGIESLAAISRLEELIDAGDVDGVFLGPHDISVTMGIPTEYGNPEFIRLIEDVVRRCRKRSVGVGMHTPLLKMKPDDLQRLLDAGMNWLLNASDIVIMRDAMRDQFRRLRELTAASAPVDTGLSAPAVRSCIT
jgi:2-keto-3-deoxy-L-rhamnonate aldolase RhmA